MNKATYPWRNLFRRKGRTILTILAVAVAVLIFSAIRTAVAMWNAGADEAAKDRLATRHKVAITMQLPQRYIEDVRGLPGVAASTWAVWFGGKDPKERTPFFAALAADHHTWFDVMDEMSLPADQLAKWKATPNGAILGDVLAKTLEVEVGSKLVINSDIYPGDWELEVVGLYSATRKTVDRNTMLLRWDYLNNDPRNTWGKDQIGWVMTRIKNAGESAAMSKQIDRLFDEKEDQTITMSERAFQLSFLGAFAAVLTAFDLVSFVILLIMTLILANTIAMSVRERTHEYGVLRAIGFPPSYILTFILAESVLVALVGGVVGIGLTYFAINVGMGPFIEQNMAAMFPYFRTPSWVLLVAVGAAGALGALAASIPAVRASRLKVTDSLRRLD